MSPAPEPHSPRQSAMRYIRAQGNARLSGRRWCPVPCVQWPSQTTRRDPPAGAVIEPQEPAFADDINLLARNACGKRTAQSLPDRMRGATVTVMRSRIDDVDATAQSAFRDVRVRLVNRIVRHTGKCADAQRRQLQMLIEKIAVMTGSASTACCLHIGFRAGARGMARNQRGRRPDLRHRPA